MKNKLWWIPPAVVCIGLIILCVSFGVFLEQHRHGDRVAYLPPNACADILEVPARTVCAMDHERFTFDALPTTTDHAVQLWYKAMVLPPNMNVTNSAHEHLENPK